MSNNQITVVAKPEKSVLAAFFLTLLFGPLGLLYASVGGGIFMIIVAIILGFVTLGLGVLITWPAAMIWGVLAALASKRTPSTSQ
jgi:phage-related minor tail protein